MMITQLGNISPNIIVVLLCFLFLKFFSRNTQYQVLSTETTLVIRMNSFLVLVFWINDKKLQGGLFKYSNPSWSFEFPGRVFQVNNAKCKPKYS